MEADQKLLVEVVGVRDRLGVDELMLRMARADTPLDAGLETHCLLPVTKHREQMPPEVALIAASILAVLGERDVD